MPAHFTFSSMSTLFGCKADGIVSARTPLKLLAPLGEEEEPVLCLWMSRYFLVKKNTKFIAEPKFKKIKIIGKKKKELKEVLKVMTCNLYLCNLFHQCSSPTYTRKKTWLCFITKNQQEYYFKPLRHSWSCYSFCKECMK